MIIAISFIGFACNSNQRTKTEPIYEPTWESLSTYNEEPEWFKDAKFGIYFHWGPYLYRPLSLNGTQGGCISPIEVTNGAEKYMVTI